MANALSNALAPAPAPPQISAPAQQGPMGGPGAAPQNAPPPPSHVQTVAAIRHFDAIARECATLLNEPDCGKTDMRSEIIDGATKLVSEGIITAADAVNELGQLPDKPFEQKKFLEKWLEQSDLASAAILQHHAMAFQGQEPPQGNYNPDNHGSIMAGLGAQYKGGAGNA